MTASLSMRTASLSFAALLVGAMILAAVSQRWQVMAPDVFGPPVVPIVIPAPEPQAPAPTPPATQSRAMEGHIAVAPPIPYPFAPPAPPAPGAGSEGAFLEPPLPVITRPDWLERPANLARYYPARALALEREGVVTLDCIVGLDGRLACAVVSETPRAWGFGEAALRIAADHRMVPATLDGAPVEARYRMRVPFALD